mmetsp:Transcript_15493/g.38374  ORF Transcript_15493/g.38374 Transcript_15493/m.38374 type:complete len:121 (-) Transcript_15493:608-970(-)
MAHDTHDWQSRRFDPAWRRANLYRLQKLQDEVDARRRGARAAEEKAESAERAAADGQQGEQMEQQGEQLLDGELLPGQQHDAGQLWAEAQAVAVATATAGGTQARGEDKVESDVEQVTCC